MESEVNQGKYGFYPCNHATYLKLKELNKHVTKALSQCANWYRWARKAPHNRVNRIRKTGVVIGPRLEPTVNPLFFTKKEYETHLSRNGEYFKNKIKEETLESTGFISLIMCDYRNARYPVQDSKDVESLDLSLEKIDELLNMLNG